MSRHLTTDEQLEKMNDLTHKAKLKEKSDDIIDRIGAFTIYASMVDFIVIQTARLMEQIILKGQLANGNQPSFVPHEDSWFYVRHFRSRKLIKDIKKLLPFKAYSSADELIAKQVSDLAIDFITKANNFLNDRNLVIHHICSPEKHLEDIDIEVDKAIRLYYETLNSHKKFVEVARPYRFGEKEIKHFYG